MNFELSKKHLEYYTFHDLLFMFWLFSEIVFSYTIISRFSLILFVGYSFLSVFRHRFYWLPFLSAYSLFLLLSAINIVGGWAVSTNIAISYTRTVFLNLCFLIALANYLLKKKTYLNILVIIEKTIVFSCLLFLIFGFRDIFSGSRLSTFGINSNVLGSFAAFIFLVILVRLINIRANILLDYIKLLLLFIIIILSGSRKAILIPLVGVSINYYIQNPKRVLRVFIISVLITITVLFILLKIDFIYKFIGYRIEPILDFIMGKEYEEGSMTTRIGFIQLAWQESFNSPIIGHGLHNFSLLPKAYGTYSHNNYTEILYSLGWLGLLVYYVPLFRLARRLFLFRSLDIFLFSTLFSLLLSILITDFFVVRYFSRDSIFFIIIIEAIFARVYKQYKKK